MSEWFYQSAKGEVVGPVTSKQLLDKVRDGSVKADSLIRKDDSQWVRAEEVGELFSRAFDSQKEHHCPFCGKSCPPPPSTCVHCYRKVPVTEEQREERREQEKKESKARRRERARERDKRMHGDAESEEGVNSVDCNRSRHCHPNTGIH